MAGSALETLSARKVARRGAIVPRRHAKVLTPPFSCLPPTSTTLRMKVSLRLSLVTCILTCLAGPAPAQTTFTLNPLSSFGSRGDGSVQPGDSIGTSPQSGFDIKISAQGVGIQPGDTDVRGTGSTNGYNMRGIAYDPISGKVILVDTHAGQAGSPIMSNNAAIYVLDPDSGQIIGTLSTNGMIGGSFTHVVVGVAA